MCEGEGARAYVIVVVGVVRPRHSDAADAANNDVAWDEKREQPLDLTLSLSLSHAHAHILPFACFVLPVTCS